MPIFEYTATDQVGRPIKGTLFSASIGNARTDLLQRGLQIESLQAAVDEFPAVSEVQPVQTPRPAPAAPNANPYQAPPAQNPNPNPAGSPTPGASPNSGIPTVGPMGQAANPGVREAFTQAVDLSSLYLFFRQMGTLVNAGIGVPSALESMTRQSRNHHLQGIAFELQKHTQDGGEMNEGMLHYPTVFSPLMVSMVRSGEKGGFLAQTLNELAGYLEDEIELRNLIRRETFWPKLTLGFSFGLIIIVNLIMQYVIKNTMFLLWSPLTELSTWFVLGPICIAIFVFVKYGLKRGDIRLWWDQLIAWVPYFGVTNRQFAMAKFGRAFAALYRGGTALPEALILASDSCGNTYISAAMKPAVAKLQAGMGITEAMASTGVMDPLVLDMLATGERTGQIDQMLINMGDFYQEEAKVRSKKSAAVFGLIVFLCVAIYVGIIVVKFWSGYFNTILGAGDQLSS